MSDDEMIKAMAWHWVDMDGDSEDFKDLQYRIYIAIKDIEATSET